MSDPRLGLTVIHRRYVGYNHAHYAGNLVDGAFTLGLFGDVATEICIRTDSDEGLFVGYASVEFLAPVRAGDVVETEGTVTRVGNRSREITFTSRVVCRGVAGTDSASQLLADPILTVRAVGTVVVPSIATVP
ncbi:3-aminobutyryl-CoA ammonia-lyase [Microlunatus panaciterrae]|uniref:3-aminobutyryl-CoA ammonia-lyase n=1 Tax=Microlunatus panaciterrae TaxID=400768 RepID=A0ABS2RDV6_9ACTN|nr:hotdog domain-containing protein [Microlunatus panaciterrae]MBM7797171.1 3-aminobutyryl-CoA ammonia-lyase [Microlunatus panaciterrae]